MRRPSYKRGGRRRWVRRQLSGGGLDLLPALENFTIEPADKGFIADWDHLFVFGVDLVMWQARVSDDEGETWDTDWTIVGNLNEVPPLTMIGFLSNNEEYLIEVRAVELDPDGLMEDPPVFTIIRTSEGVGGLVTPIDDVTPEPIESLILTPGDESALFSFYESPAQDKEHYEFRISSDDGETWAPNWTNFDTLGDPLATEGTLSSLINDVEILVEFRVIDDDGLISTIVSDTTTPTAP